jgi:hypothetical protein
VVTDLSQDALVGSSIENGTMIMQCALRKRAFPCALGTPATIGWRQAPYPVDLHELSTFHHPIQYRVIIAPGSSLNDQNPRVSFPPDLQGGSTSQHMSHSILRLAGSLAVVCGGSRRHMALLFSTLVLLPLTQSSSKRWIDDMGSHFPPPEQMRQPLRPLLPVTEGHLDSSSPRGTDHWVMVVKDAHDRILITHEAASEKGDEAQPLLQRCTDRGLTVPAAVSDSSQRCTEALTAVYPAARFQAAHFQTVKKVWGHRKQSLVADRRQVKASGEAQQEEACRALAKQ